MKVSGFTFIRNAIKYDYPIEEAVRSILPLCDEVVVAVGKSEDGTLAMVQAISPKVRAVETEWDDSLREGGRVLAQETDKAFRAISPESDWAFYIQGDEVLHEKYIDTVRTALEKWEKCREVDGLLFNYRHFYGSYDHVGISPKWYAKEIRVVRNRKDIYSYKDAQGFRGGNDKKLRVKSIDAEIYHYGWVKEPKAMQRKQESFHKLWHDDRWMEQNVAKKEEFDYSGIDALERFVGTHPKVMAERVERSNWKFDFDPSFNRLSLKNRLKRFIRQKTGIILGYKNYRIL